MPCIIDGSKQPVTSNIPTFVKNRDLRLVSRLVDFSNEKGAGSKPGALSSGAAID